MRGRVETKPVDREQLRERQVCVTLVEERICPVWLMRFTETSGAQSRVLDRSLWNRESRTIADFLLTLTKALLNFASGEHKSTSFLSAATFATRFGSASGNATGRSWQKA